MIELVLTLCLAAQPGVCMDQQPPLAEPLSLMGCMVAGPQIAAAWVAEHQEWRVTRWRCGVGVIREAHA